MTLMGLKFQNLQLGDPYYANWLEMRRRTVIFWVCFAALPPVWGILEVARELTLVRLAWTFAAMVALAIAFFFIRFWQVSWPCPRCGNSFYIRLFGPIQDSCLYCGLPEYAPHGDF
jgi:hypothetical protein